MISDKTRMGSVSESDSGSLSLGEDEELLVLEESEEGEQEGEDVGEAAAAPKTIRVQMRRIWVGKCSLNVPKTVNQPAEMFFG